MHLSFGSCKGLGVLTCACADHSLRNFHLGALHGLVSLHALGAAALACSAAAERFLVHTCHSCFTGQSYLVSFLARIPNSGRGVGLTAKGPLLSKIDLRGVVCLCSLYYMYYRSFYSFN